MSALAQFTDLDHAGGVGEEVTEDQVGSPERLGGELAVGSSKEFGREGRRGEVPYGCYVPAAGDGGFADAGAWFEGRELESGRDGVWGVRYRGNHFLRLRRYVF
jgi:hypothetical protein